MSWVRSLLGVFRSRARLVGTDLAGNQYFEQVTTRGRPRRSVQLKERKSLEAYTQDTVPPEWDRWIRGLRADPPSLEEMEVRVRQGEILRHKITNVEKRDAEIREEEIKDGLVAPGPDIKVKAGNIGGQKIWRFSLKHAAVDHASAPSYKSKSETTESPTSTGKDFQPASWKPKQ